MVMDSNFAQVYGAGNLAGKKPAGWFSRRHQTAAEHNHAVDVYGNRRARKARRVERARLNAKQEQINCIECGGKHREDRCYKVARVLQFLADKPWDVKDRGQKPELWSFYDQPQPTDMDLLNAADDMKDYVLRGGHSTT